MHPYGSPDGQPHDPHTQLPPDPNQANQGWGAGQWGEPAQPYAQPAQPVDPYAAPQPGADPYGYPNPAPPAGNWGPGAPATQLDPYGSAPPDPYAAPPQYGQPQYGQPQYGQPQYGQPQYGQPQYGQPQYGQPGGPYSPYGPAQPPKPPKSKGRVALLAAVVLVVLAGAGLLGARLLGTKQLSHTAVEKAIEEQSQDTTQSYAPLTNVQCNDGKNVAVKKNATFTCTADGGKKITVTIKTNDADYEWVVTN